MLWGKPTPKTIGRDLKNSVILTTLEANATSYSQWARTSLWQ